MLRIIILALLIFSTHPALAGQTIRAALCDGCSLTQMSAKATNTTNNGTVYVFNSVSARANKYAVVTEVIDTTPYTAWTQAIPMKVEGDIQRGFTDFVRARTQAGGEGVIDLPPDSPVRSVAGALVEPGSTSTYIEDFIRTLSAYEQMEFSMGALIVAILKRNIPLLDVSSVLKVLTITIRFPDGSTQDYEIYFSQNISNNSEPQLEVEAAGNAKLEDGRPAPTGPLGFRNLSFSDHGGSLAEWITLAKLHGVTISGSKKGSFMTCSVEGNVIKCVLVARP